MKKMIKRTFSQTASQLALMALAWTIEAAIVIGIVRVFMPAPKVTVKPTPVIARPIIVTTGKASVLPDPSDPAFDAKCKVVHLDPKTLKQAIGYVVQ